MNEGRPESKGLCTYLSRRSTLQHPARSPTWPEVISLFPNTEGVLGGRRFKSDEEVRDAIKAWLHGLAAEVYGEGIQKLVTGYDK